MEIKKTYRVVITLPFGNGKIIARFSREEYEIFILKILSAGFSVTTSIE